MKYFIFFLIFGKTFSRIIISIDFTQVGMALIGNQTFSHRSKFSTILELINFRGIWGKMGLRCVCMTFVLVASYYGPDGTRTETFDVIELLFFPFTQDYATLQGWVDLLTSSKMLFDYILLLIVITCVGLAKFY